MNRKLTFNQKPTVDARSAIAEALLGKTTGASKGSRPAPGWDVQARPTGGLKPDGFKIKATKKF